MLHLCRTKNKLIPRPVRKGRKIASDKSAFLYAFAIITINKWLVQQITALNAATADAYAM